MALGAFFRNFRGMASFFHGRVPGPALSLLCGALAFAHLSGLAPARAQIQPTTGSKSLGSQVNGSTSACRSGACAITGGTGAGANLFHRFDSFDTRSGITGVSIDPAGKANVILGVISPTGTFLDAIVTLGSKANLFWLSPGGISISGGGFRNVANLSLSTAPSLQVGAGTFNVFDTTAEQLAALTGPPDAFLPSSGRTGSIVLSDGLLELDGNLLLDADTLTTRGRNTVSAPWTLSLDTWTNEGALVFDNGSAATFLRETEWINTSDGAISLGGTNINLISNPFAGIPDRGDAAVAPNPVVQGPAGGRVTLRNVGEIYKSTDSTQILSRVDLKNLKNPAASDFFPSPNDRLPKSDPVYTGRLELTAGTLQLDDSSVISEQTGSIFLLSDSRLEVQRADPLVNQGFIGGMGTLRLAQAGNGTLENRGVIAPGLRGTVGRFGIEGNLVQPADASSAIIDVDIGQGVSDLLTATGRVDLRGGRIEAYGLQGYSPSKGDAFSVIEAGGGLSLATSVQQVLPPGIVSVVRDGTTYDLITGAQLSDTQLYFLTRTRVDPFRDNDQLALLTVTLDQAGFGLEGFGAAEGSVGSIGSSSSLDPLQTQKEFLEGETEASALTRSRLGLTGTTGEASLNPEEVQRLLRQAADRVRSECPQEGKC